MLLLNFLSIHNIHTTLKETSLNTHTCNLLNKSRLSSSITSKHVNIFRIFCIASKLFENFINLLPFSENCSCAIFELKINIMCFSEAWRKIFECSFGNFDDLHASLVYVHLYLLHFLRKLGSQLNINFFNTSLIIFRIQKPLDQTFGYLYFINRDLIVMLDQSFQLCAALTCQLFITVLLKFIEFSSCNGCDRYHRWHVFTCCIN